MALGNFKNSDSEYYYPITNTMANKLSEYMKGRQYKYSNYQQLLNLFGKEYNSLEESLTRHKDNLFPESHRLDDMDVIYTVNTENKIFTDGDGSLYESEFTDIDKWWKSHPDKIEHTDFNNTTYFSSGTPVPIIDVSTFFKNPSPVYITLLSDTGNYSKNIYGEQLKPSVARISGFDAYGNKKTEELEFGYPTYNKSRHGWIYIDKIEFILWDSYDKFEYSISCAPFNFLSMENIEDKYILSEDDSKNKHSIFWSWDSVNKHLYQKESNYSNLKDYASGITGFNNISKYSLCGYDTDNQNFIKLNSIDSILFDETGYYFYVLSGGFLLAYNKLPEYSHNVNYAANRATSDPIISLNIKKEDNKITFSGVYKSIKLNKRIIKYRFLIKYKSDTYYWNGISWESFEGSEWTDYELASNIGFYSPNLEYDIPAFLDDDIIIIVDAMLNNGSIESDTFIIDKEIKLPLYQVEFNKADTFLSYDYNGKIITDSSIVNLINRSFIYDSDNKLAIFAHRFENIVNNSNPIDMLPFNTSVLIDNYGEINSLLRKLGEKVSDYKFRLMNYVYSNSNFTHNDNINSISSELGLVKIPVILINKSEGISVDYNGKHLKVGGGSIDINSYTTLDDIKIWLESLSGIDVLYNLDNIEDMPSKSLLYFSNRSVYKHRRFPSVKRAFPELAEDEFIESIIIENDTNDLNFTITAGRAIEFNRELTNFDFITIITNRKNNMLFISPVIIESYYDLHDKYFSYGSISNEYMQIQDVTDGIYPIKYTK